MKTNYSNIVLLFTLIVFSQFFIHCKWSILKSNNLEVKQAKYELALEKYFKKS